MGIFDRFRRKEQPPKRRSYAGVNTSRLFADFSTMTRSSDAELKPALRVLRNRCRELSRNDEYVRRYLGLLKTNVVGPYGVNVQAKARNADGSLDAPGNKIVENAWKAWGQRGNCTVDGRLSWVYLNKQLNLIPPTGTIFGITIKTIGIWVVILGAIIPAVYCVYKWPVYRQKLFS